MAVSYNGTDNNHKISSALGLTDNSEFAFWGRVDSTSEKGLMVALGINTTNGLAFGVGLDNADTLGNDVIGVLDGVAWLDSNTAISINTWHFFQLRSNGSNATNVWMDGTQLVNTATNPSAPGANFSIGSGGSTSARFCDCEIAHVIASTLATGGTNMAKNGVNPFIAFYSTVTIKGYYPLANADSTEPDYSLNRNHLTATNTPTKFAGNPPVEHIENYL